jgi:hypothetical protein
MGTVKEAEHGPGAAQAIGSLRRVRPLLRFEAGISLRIKVVPRIFDALGVFRGRFLF